MKEKGVTVEAGKTDEEVKEKTLKCKKNFHISHSMLDCKYYNFPRGGGQKFNLKIWPPHTSHAVSLPLFIYSWSDSALSLCHVLFSQVLLNEATTVLRPC